ncbi:hypothetical protein PINS_up016703, partial [Pythium insidiosum]
RLASAMAVAMGAGTSSRGALATDGLHIRSVHNVVHNGALGGRRPPAARRDGAVAAASSSRAPRGSHDCAAAA